MASFLTCKAVFDNVANSTELEVRRTIMAAGSGKVTVTNRSQFQALQQDVRKKVALMGQAGQQSVAAVEVESYVYGIFSMLNDLAHNLLVHSSDSKINKK